MPIIVAPITNFINPPAKNPMKLPNPARKATCACLLNKNNTARRKTRRNPQQARPGLRKTARYSKTSAQSAKRNLYMIFKVSKSGVTYLSTPTPNKAMFRLHKGEAVLFQSKLAAKSVAAAAARRTAAKYGVLGVTKYGTTESEIRAAVSGEWGKGKVKRVKA